MARAKVCILQGFSRLIVGFDVQHGFLCESPSFENYCFRSQNVSLNVKYFSDISAVNFIVGWNLLASLINRVGTCEIFLLYALALMKCISLLLFRAWRNILFFTNYTQIIIIIVNYQDYNHLIFQTLDISLSILDLVDVSTLDCWLVTLDSRQLLRLATQTLIETICL